MTDDPDRWQRINRLLEEALEQPEHSRSRWLDDACGGDEALKREVLELLSFDGEETGGLRRNIETAAVDVVADSTDAMVGREVGGYRITGKLAQGGMGTVFVANRVAADFDQQVAVKLLMGHQYSDEALGRFVAERRILAALEHPNIARLIDGGTLDERYPYIVMEYVDGVTIDRYCRDNALDNRAIIRLVLKVADALQYAHRRLIIHRDIKPSNILVDAQGNPKLLDFGIAKLLDDDEGAGQVLTRADWRILTPLYASPEQIEGQPITTAADVYGLGLLLYRLLTGRLPYSADSNRPRDVEDAIVSQPAEKPSVAVGSTAGVSEGELAADAWVRRQSRALKGDLDTILLAALRKEPERRYPSIGEFADDLERFLDDLPIRSRRDSLAYTSAKFLRRHRLPIGIAATLTAVAIGLTAWYTAELQTERRTAEQTAEILQRVFAARDPNVRNQSDVTIGNILERGLEELEDEPDLSPIVRGRLLGTLADVTHNLGELERADELATEALELVEAERSADHEDLALPLEVLTRVRTSQRRLVEARQLGERLLRLNSANHGSNSLEVARAANLLALAGYFGGDYAEMERWAMRSWEIRRRLPDPEAARLDLAANLLGICHWVTGDLTEAQHFLNESARLQDEHEEPNHLGRANTLHNLGLVEYDLGDFESAAGRFRDAIDIRRAAAGADDPYVADSLYSLANVETQLGRFVDAHRHYEEQLPLQAAVTGREHPMVAYALTGHGIMLVDMGETDRGADKLDEAAEIEERLMEPDHPDRAAGMVGRAYVAIAQGRYVEAEALIENALAIRIGAFGENNGRVARTRTALARLELARGDTAAARLALHSSIDIFEANGQPEHPFVGEALTWLARVELADGNPASASEAILEALRIDAVESGERHLPTIRRKLLLADIRRAAGDAASADRLRATWQPAEERMLAEWNAAMAR